MHAKAFRYASVFTHQKLEPVRCFNPEDSTRGAERHLHGVSRSGSRIETGAAEGADPRCNNAWLLAFDVLGFLLSGRTNKSIKNPTLTPPPQIKEPALSLPMSTTMKGRSTADQVLNVRVSGCNGQVQNLVHALKLVNQTGLLSKLSRHPRSHQTGFAFTRVLWTCSFARNLFTGAAHVTQQREGRIHTAPPN